jgi:hypothetical protein
VTPSLFVLHQVFPALRPELRRFHVTDARGMTHLVHALEAADADNQVAGAVLVVEL